MLLLYKENNKLTFCEYDGDYVIFINKQGQLRKENARFFTGSFRNSLTASTIQNFVGFVDTQNKKHNIKNLLATIVDYEDLYDSPLTERVYRRLVGYNKPFEDQVCLVIDKATNAFTFCTQGQIDKPKKTIADIITANKLYLPDGRIISLADPLNIRDFHYVNLNQYVNAKPYKDVKKVILEILKVNLKGVSGTTSSKQGYLPKYKEKELSNLLKYSNEMFKCLDSNIKLGASKIIYNAQAEFALLYKSLTSYNRDCLGIDYKSGQVIYTYLDGDRTSVAVSSTTLVKFKESIEKLMQSSFPSLSNKTVDTVEIDYNSVIVTYTDKFKAKLVKED